mgnify:CR=1 FL=1
MGRVAGRGDACGLHAIPHSGGLRQPRAGLGEAQRARSVGADLVAVAPGREHVHFTVAHDAHDQERRLDIRGAVVPAKYDRQADGTMVPLPKPSVDTGAGLERIAAVMQGVANNFHSDVFTPLIEEVEKVVGIKYEPGFALGRQPTPSGPRAIDPASFRVIADHARAVALISQAIAINPADDAAHNNCGNAYLRLGQFDAAIASFDRLGFPTTLPSAIK